MRRKQKDIKKQAEEKADFVKVKCNFKFNAYYNEIKSGKWDTIKTFSTLNELELLRKQVKGEILFTEDLVKSDYHAIVSDSRSLITQTVMSKALLMSLKFLAKQLDHRLR